MSGERERIAFLCSEVAPFSKTGGLADVAAALPPALAKLGAEVRVFAPHHRAGGLGADAAQSGVDGAPAAKISEPIEVRLDQAGSMRPSRFAFRLIETVLPNTEVPLFLVDAPALFERDAVYTNDPDEPFRFLYFCRAVLESCQRFGFAPTVFHCNDWQTAMVPLLVKTAYAWDRLFGSSKSLLTIHNLAYQGVFSREANLLTALGLDDLEMLDAEDAKQERINFLKTGLRHADHLSTVSPSYAEEIQRPEHGAGLDPWLRARREELTGILNGVDYGIWSPETDSHIPHRYSDKNLEKKKENKRALIEEVHPRLDQADGAERPLVGMVSRLSYQKGIELLFESLPELLLKKSIALAVLGSGETQYERFFMELQSRFPGLVYFYRGFNDGLAHWIEAAADIFLMPSRYEPCGLNQMYSLKYGTVPVVRKTGGLADSVEPVVPSSGEGTGIVFDHFTADGVRWALGTAAELFGRPKLWRQIQKNGMARDFSWSTQAQQYMDLYDRLSS